LTQIKANSTNNCDFLKFIIFIRGCHCGGPRQQKPSYTAGYTEFWSGNVNGRYCLEDLGMNGRILFKMALKMYHVRVQTGFKWIITHGYNNRWGTS
jgi:hypothetical protein